MRRTVKREQTDNHRFAAGNSLTMLPHSLKTQFKALKSPWDRRIK